MMLARSTRNGIVLFAFAALVAAGCRAFHNVVGLAEPINDNLPLEPGAGVPDGNPVLVPFVRDTILAVGDTETVMGTLYVSPVTRFSQPTGTFADYSQPTASYADTTERVATHDIGIVGIDGTRITARSPGQAIVIVSGLLGPYVVGANFIIHVHP
jgi:hypothetical protein